MRKHSRSSSRSTSFNRHLKAKNCCGRAARGLQRARHACSHTWGTHSCGSGSRRRQRCRRRRGGCSRCGEPVQSRPPDLVGCTAAGSAAPGSARIERWPGRTHTMRYVGILCKCRHVRIIPCICCMTPTKFKVPLVSDSLWCDDHDEIHFMPTAHIFPSSPIRYCIYHSIRAGCSAERRDTRLVYDLNGCDLESCGTRLSIDKRCTIHTTSTNHRHDITTDTHWRMRNCVSRDRKTGRSRHLKALVLATREPCAAKRHRRRAPLSRRTALVHPASARCTWHIFTPAVWAAIVRPTAACADAKRA